MVVCEPVAESIICMGHSVYQTHTPDISSLLTRSIFVSDIFQGRYHTPLSHGGSCYRRYRYRPLRPPDEDRRSRDDVWDYISQLTPPSTHHGYRAKR